MQVIDYTKIGNPYNSSDLGRTADLNFVAGDPNLPVGGSSENTAVRSPGGITDLWINSFVRSTNWKPRTVGFTIDGETGYAEFSNVYISGTIEVGKPLGAEIIIQGNNINLYDDTTGGTDPITGDTASINFIRSDDSTQYFTIQKRASTVHDTDNVLEIFSTEPPANRYNYIFLGRAGGRSEKYVGNVTISTLWKPSEAASQGNGIIGMEINQDGLELTTYDFFMGNAQYAGAPTAGVMATMRSRDSICATYAMGYPGGSTVAGLGFNGKADITNITITSNVLVVTAANKFYTGQSVILSGLSTFTFLNNQTVQITSRDNTSFHANFTHTDVSGADSGLVTGAGITIGFYQTSDNTVAMGLDIIPDTDNAYDIGSASYQIHDLYVGGIIHGGSGVTSTAGQDLNAGDPVGYSNTLTDTVATALITAQLPTFSDSISDFRIVSIGTDKFACVYTHAATGYGCTFVAQIDRTTMSATIGNVVTAVISSGRIAKLDTNKYAVVGFDNIGDTIYQVVFSVSGTTITNQGSNTIGGTAYGSKLSANQIGTDKIIISYADTFHGSYVVCVTYSGYTATWGTAVSTGFTDTHELVVNKVGTDKFVVVDCTISGGVISAKIGDIATRTITLGTTQTIGLGLTGGASAVSIASVNSISCFVIRSFVATRSVLLLSSVSGTTITWQAILETDLNSGSVMSDGTNIYEASNTGSAATSTIALLSDFFTTFTKTVIMQGVDFGLGIPVMEYDPTNTYYYALSANSATGYPQVYIQGMSNNFIGFAKSTVAKGSSVNVIIKGVDTNQSGLQPGNIYQVTSSGLVLSGDPTVANKVVAKSATEIEF